MGTGCIFCQMTRNEIPCHIIDSNDEFMAFLTIFPNTLGAAVVIPKKHYTSYAFDLDDEVLLCPIYQESCEKVRWIF